MEDEQSTIDFYGKQPQCDLGQGFRFNWSEERCMCYWGGSDVLDEPTWWDPPNLDDNVNPCQLPMV